MKYILIVIFCCTSLSKGFAQMESPFQELAQDKIIIGAKTTAFDDLRFTPKGEQLTDPISLNRQGKLRFARTGISLFTNPALVSPYNQVVNVKLDCQLEYINFNTPNAKKTKTFTLSISFDPANNYKNKDVFWEEEAAWSNLTINKVRITDANGNPLIITGLAEPLFLLRHQLHLERYRTPVVSQAPEHLRDTLFCDNLHLKFKWKPIDWAVEYEVEWTYADDYKYGSSTPKPLSALKYNFRHNATRVRLKETQYEIPTVFERGYVIYRVRAIGRKGTDFQQIVPGAWSRPTAGSLSESDRDFAFFQIKQGFEKDRMNWQYEAIFAEEGKRKDLLRFADGTNRIRQEQTNLNTENKLLIGETIYDQTGRPAVSILPVPIDSRFGGCPNNESPAMNFKSAFNQNPDKKPYSWVDFERLSSTNCDLEAKPLGSGAAKYYGKDNPDKTNAQAYVPDAEGFPFVQTQYTPDNTGRVLRQGGLGKDFQLGKGHEQKYYYGIPAQIELDRIFGNEAGFAKHYQKKAMLDENGQMNLEYSNLAGQVVATALAGQTPQNLTSIERTAPTTNIVIDLISEDNQKEPDGNGLFASRAVIISQPTTATFSYKLTPNRFQPNCPANAALCYDCVYDLQISVTDECGKSLVDVTQHIGNLNPLTSCESIPFEMPLQSLQLKPGTYMVTKRLRLDASVRNQYVSNFLQQTCVTRLGEQWIQDALNGVDPKQCDQPCIACTTLPPELSPAKSVIITGEDGIPRTVNLPATVLAKTANGCVSACNETSANIPETTALQSLISDLSPGGQYAEYYDVSKKDDPLGPICPESFPLSILNSTNSLPVTGANWRNPDIVYQSSDGNEAFIELRPDELAEPRHFIGAPHHTTPDGHAFIRPQQLYSVKDFIDKWQSSWAYALLPFHPEYGYYLWVVQHKESNAYNTKIIETNTYSTAAASGLTRYLESGLATDPFFAQYPALVPLMMDSLRFADSINYRTSPTAPLTRRFFSINDIAYISANCNNPAFSGPQVISCLGTKQPFTMVGAADEEWKTYRGIYLAKKTAVTESQRNRYITDKGYFNNNYIGNTSGGFYLTKIKRFPSVKDSLPLRDEHGNRVFDGANAFRRFHALRLYKTCGICPIAKDLETVLTGLAQRNLLTTPVTLPGTPSFSLTPAMVRQFSVPKDARYEWTPQVVSETSLRIIIRASNAKVNVCTLQLNKVSTAMRWADIRFFTCVKALAEHEFTMMAYDANSNSIEIQGTASCFNLKTCTDVSNKPVCIKLPIADDLAAFLNYLFYSKKFKCNNCIVHKKGQRSPYFSTALETLVPSAGTYKWNYNSLGASGTLKGDLIAEIGSNIQKCRFTFTIVEPGFNYDMIRRITAISKGSGIDQYAFVLTAETTDGRVFHINSKSDNCIILFNCNPFNDNVPESTVLCCIPIFPTVNPEVPNCAEHLRELAVQNAKRKFFVFVEHLRDSIGNAYSAHCLKALEQSQFRYNEDIYQYTLYYYDRAGNLTQTVPPKGVAVLSDAQIATVNQTRYNGTGTRIFPNHKMKTTYAHNTLNAVTVRNTPDDGTTRYCYDELGRIILAQDAQQATDKACTYLLYDIHGRLSETGRMSFTTAVNPFPTRLFYKEKYLPNWYDTRPRTEIYHTYYDKNLSTAISAHFEGGQQNLRNRIASVSYQASKNAAYDYATHYGYDVLGNIKELVQENAKLQRDYATKLPDLAAQSVKKIRYQYDLQSGKVTRSLYQPGMADQFVHWFDYDADNRIINVYSGTSLYEDVALRDRDAHYAYYQHGPLARIELGMERVQGLDYAYTLQGWLKGINSLLDVPNRDMGNDGANGCAADVYGFSLGYFKGDYKHIGAPSKASFLPQYPLPAVNAVEQNSRDLWNGNIAYTASRIGGISNPVTANVYAYDQLQRLCSTSFYAMKPATGGRYNTDGLPWEPQTAYKTTYEYDPNGNILQLQRNGLGGMFDNLRYNYPQPTSNNRLGHITDTGTRLADASDLPNQTSSNYTYDPKGRLLTDRSEGNSALTWSNTDKLKSQTRDGKTTVFEYDALGRRSLKKKDENNLTLYVRDATGNILAEYKVLNGKVYWHNSPIYGASRIGIYQPDNLKLTAAASTTAPTRSTAYRGWKQYELNSHIGDVLATVSDRRIPATVDGIPVLKADLLSAQDYYAFGMPMPGRSFEKGTGRAYRYGFQGMEKEDDWKGKGNSYTTEFRQYDARVGRWLSVDAMAGKYAGWTPFNFTKNNTILKFDPNGKDVIVIIWATHSGNIGHAGIAVSNYKKVYDNFTLTGDETETSNEDHYQLVPDGTYTYYDYWPGQRVGNKNYDQDVPAITQKENDLNITDLKNEDVSKGEGRSADGVLQISTDYETDQKVIKALMDFKGNNPNYNGSRCNCSDFVESGVEAAHNRQLPVDEKIFMENKSTTPNQLWRTLSKLQNTTVLKSPGSKVSNGFLYGRFELIMREFSPVNTAE